MNDLGLRSPLAGIGLGFLLSWLALPLARRLALLPADPALACRVRRLALLGSASLPLLVVARSLLPLGMVPKLPVVLHVEAWLGPTEPLPPGRLLAQRLDVHTLLAGAGLLWLALLAAGLSREVARALGRRRLVEHAVPLPPDAHALLVQACARAGLRRVTALVSGELVHSGVVGVFRPIVLVPHADLELAPHALRLLFRHELEHVRRHDTVWQCLEQWAASAFAWHPSLPSLLDGLALAREAAVDRRVAGKDPARYTELLLHVAQRHAPPREVTVSSGTALERRIEMLLNPQLKPSRTAIPSALSVTGILLALGLVAPSGLAQTFQHRMPPPEEIEPKVKTDTDECYATARVNDPKLVVDTQAMLHLDSKGVVTSASIPSSSAVFQGCLEQRARGWHFPPPEGAPPPPPDAKLVVSFPIQRKPE